MRKDAVMLPLPLSHILLMAHLAHVGFSYKLDVQNLEASPSAAGSATTGQALPASQLMESR